ncbi:MAG: DUF1801 domain-containing protein [Patescibacteria group bacterium]
MKTPLHPQVASYFQKQTPERQAILHKLRELIFKNLPQVEENWAWGVPVYDGGKFYLASLKNQVNMGFSIVGLSNSEASQFEGGGKTARHIKIHSLESIDEKLLSSLIKLVHQKASCPE